MFFYLITIYMITMHLALYLFFLFYSFEKSQRSVFPVHLTMTGYFPLFLNSNCFHGKLYSFIYFYFSQAMKQDVLVI